jgi:hypothetical protein
MHMQQEANHHSNHNLWLQAKQIAFDSVLLYAARRWS